MADWTPKGAGLGFEYSRVLKPLERFREQTLVLSGLAHRNGYALGDGPGDHARAAASYLTGVHPRKTAGADIQNGISVDQIVAQHLAPHTRFPSIELGCDDSRTVGNCDSGYSCAYTNSLAWRGPATPMPPETNPRLVFERLFGDLDTSLAPETRARRLFYRRSILDLVAERTAELAANLGASDRRKLDEYLSSIREIERRIEKAEQDPTGLTPAIDKPTGIPVLYPDYVKLMFDLQVIAFQCDLTRVITLMIGHEHSGMTFPQIGVTDAHHPISHHQQEPEKVEKMAKINAYHVQMFARLLHKLQATPDGDGTLLDHVTMMYGMGMADSNSHSPIDIPMILAGGGAGHLKGGRHIRFKNMPLANLHLTLLDQFGVHQDRIGDSTGRVDATILSL